MRAIGQVDPALAINILTSRARLTLSATPLCE
jgi:hypothetical protein